MSVGGFPEPFFDGNEREARRWRRERFERIIKEDIRDLESIRHISLLDLFIHQLRSRVGNLIVREFTINNLHTSGFNNNIPFGQCAWTLNFFIIRLHFFFCKPNSLFIWLFHQLDNWVYPFPCHRKCPIDCFWYWIQQFSVPVLFQYSPTSFNRIVLAMIRGVINQADSQTAFVTEFGHSANEETMLSSLSM